ncbi:hydroxymethylglutaryl-CoA lyase [Rhodobium gokarnense]|uniref:Hydroxymethylglutaryl-CoA lyase n=1 Tax=Rhodobium gokarnense TaxID=364296 RepID=A0ABT3HFH4_9HYPH|nr:hydroxymethylglutaryl-CoA lyase [Rhodobium gokarnense]MCW2309079.1 hydroxymethylglutaryl-CoA lyase [Rhodobium gokarnense]
MSRAAEIYPRAGVSLREVGLRDGLQLVKAFPSTAGKTEWIKRAHGAGVRHFEVGSFLPASRMPQFADLRELIGVIAGLEGARSAALALNERGADDAMASGVDEVVCVVSATEEHSQANMRRSREAAIDLVRTTTEKAADAPKRPLVMAAISMAFGCSIAGPVDPAEVVRLAGACLDAGADIVGVADTVGFCGPKQVEELCTDIGKLCGDIPYLVHLHDTRGMGIANAAAALNAGARILDGSIGGLGGCPFAPGATGNVVFEDLVYLCETMGFATGIDLEALFPVREILANEMPNEPLYGALARAGLPATVSYRH